MRVIIDIPNWLYNAIMERKEPQYSQSLGDAVRDGTPLPENCGVLISRQAAIEALQNHYEVRNPFVGKNTIVDECVDMLRELPTAQSESCEGCKHFGKWENEVEYGYSSPCTYCKRRVGDQYAR